MVRIAQFGSSPEGCWFLSRKARELLDYHSISPSRMCFAADAQGLVRFIGGALAKHGIPFRFIDDLRVRRDDASLLMRAGALHYVRSSGDYWFLLLAHPLRDARERLVESLAGQQSAVAYLALCGQARQEGQDLASLLRAEISPPVELASPVALSFRNGSGGWLCDCPGRPRWMVPEILLRVVDELAHTQAEFLDRGPTAIRPLTIKQLAHTLGCSQSTISRTIAGVEAETPWGRVPLKRFFSVTASQTGNASVSQAALIAHLQDLISAEDKADPVSDDELAHLLSQRGIDVSRRVIAKHRRNLGFAASFRRRRCT
jgi:hypothetical protein